jgi:hypothetical protein
MLCEEWDMSFKRNPVEYNPIPHVETRKLQKGLYAS